MNPNEHMQQEIAYEQRHVDIAYERLDVMRIQAESVRGAYSDVRAGGPHQARLERDIANEVTNRRLSDLNIGQSPLVFGRLDLDSSHPDDDTSTWYIGRLAVDDAEHTPLVIDWRAPIAEPFYRATAVEPMHVIRRRHFLTKSGREITGIDDEVFNAAATEEAGFTVAGEGALLAALDRHRTGRMGDIVATIQAEQDEAIRSELQGVILVTGGPGTGKTAVALHRAAYLLYTHRRHLASRGVLLVGPSTVFIRYIEQVLPSLGESDVQLATIATLKPQLAAIRHDAPEVAAIKAQANMAHVIERAVYDRERVLREDVSFMVDGMRVRFSREDSARVIRGAQKQKGTHNERRRYVVRRVNDILVSNYKHAANRTYQRTRADRDRGHASFDATSEVGAPESMGFDSLVGRNIARGERLPEGFEQELASRLRRQPVVREMLEHMWPVLTGAELINDLLGFRALVNSAAAKHLNERERELLHRARKPEIREVLWTTSDVALVDEADALLGSVELALPKRKRRSADASALEAAERVIDNFDVGHFTNAADIAARYGETSRITETTTELRTFAHVLVDEAQDLSPMQWRMLARRCPTGSFTIVGDLGQASQPGSAHQWETVLDQLPHRGNTRTANLTVNYRTPAEIMEIAARLLAAATPHVEPSRSVRRTDELPRFVRVENDDVMTTAERLTREATQRGGTVAVLAHPSQHAALLQCMHDLGAVGDSAEALDAKVAVLDAVAAKGLEFDHVVVLEPSLLVNNDAAGLRLLYVTITRATKTLAVVHSGELPESLQQ